MRRCLRLAVVSPLLCAGLLGLGPREARAEPATPVHVLEHALPAPNPHSGQVEDRLRLLAAGAIDYRPPARLRPGERTAIRLRLNPAAGDGALGDPVRIEATLSGDESIEVTPAGPQSRSGWPEEAAIWEWQVRPIAAAADATLTLRLEAFPTGREGDPPIHVQTYSAPVLVEMRLQDRVAALVRQEAALVAIAAGVGAGALALAGWRWRRRVARRRADNA